MWLITHNTSILVQAIYIQQSHAWSVFLHTKLKCWIDSRSPPEAILTCNIHHIYQGCIASLCLGPLVGEFAYIFLISSWSPPCLLLISSSSPHISFSTIFSSSLPQILVSYSSFDHHLLQKFSFWSPSHLLISFFSPPHIYLFPSSLHHILPAQGLWDKQTQRLKDSKTQRLRDFRVGESLGVLVSLKVNYGGNSCFVAVFNRPGVAGAVL